jgi:hypothetical protein
VRPEPTVLYILMDCWFAAKETMSCVEEKQTRRCRLKEQPFGCLELGRQKTRSLRKSK